MLSCKSSTRAHGGISGHLLLSADQVSVVTQRTKPWQFHMYGANSHPLNISSSLWFDLGDYSQNPSIPQFHNNATHHAWRCIFNHPLQILQTAAHKTNTSHLSHLLGYRTKPEHEEAAILTQKLN